MNTAGMPIHTASVSERLSPDIYELWASAMNVSSITDTAEITSRAAFLLFLPSVSATMKKQKKLNTAAASSITISKEALSFYDEASSSWKAEAGKFEALVGNAADNLKLKKAFELF